MRTESKVRTIAVLAIDGENFEVDGHYEGKEHRPRWYTITKTSDRSVRLDNLTKFPTHDSIRELLN